MVVLENERGAFVRKIIHKVVMVTKTANNAMKFKTEEVADDFKKKHGLSDNFSAKTI